MVKAICSVDECDFPLTARGMCRHHYNKWWKERGGTVRKCLGCGLVIRGRGGRRFCSETCRPRCGVDGCERAAIYQKDTLCSHHDAQRRKYGAAKPFVFEWADPTPCQVCGDPPAYGFRRFCSRACFAAERKYGDDLQTSGPCVSCGEAIDYLTTNGDGHKRFRLLHYCRPCSKRWTIWGMTAVQLANRDGLGCAICKAPIDLELRKFDPGGFMCASVDHIIPRSLGGTDDSSNLQLVHLLCNIRKGNRLTPP